MGLKAVITAEEYEGLDDGPKGFYKKSGESYVLDVEDVDSHPTVKGLTATLKKYRDIAPDAKALKAKLDEANTLREQWGDMDHEETVAALARLKELQDGAQKDSDVEAKIAAIRADLEKAHTKALGQKDRVIAERDATILEMKTFIDKSTLDGALDRALADPDNKILPEYRKAARALILTEFKPKVIRVDGGDYHAQFVTELGDLDAKDFVAKWVTTDDAQQFLEGSGNRGTGTSTDRTTGGANVKNPWKQETWNLTEQGKMLKEKPALARQLAQSAGRKIA